MSLRALAAVLLASALVITGCQGSSTMPRSASTSLGGPAPSARVMSPTADSWTTIELRRLQQSPGTPITGARIPFNGAAEIVDPLPDTLWPLPVTADRAKQIASAHAQGDFTCRAGLLTDTQQRRDGHLIIRRRPVWLCFALNVEFPILGPGTHPPTYVADELVFIDARTGRYMSTASA